MVGHKRDPIHPAADAAMLAEELPDTTFVEARSILEWRYRPAAAQQDRCRLRGPVLRERRGRAAPARLTRLVTGWLTGPCPIGPYCGPNDSTAARALNG